MPRQTLASTYCLVLLLQGCCGGVHLCVRLGKGEKHAEVNRRWAAHHATLHTQSPHPQLTSQLPREPCSPPPALANRTKLGSEVWVRKSFNCTLGQSSAASGEMIGWVSFPRLNMTAVPISWLGTRCCLSKDRFQGSLPQGFPRRPCHHHKPFLLAMSP